jgi:hypothetical protein
MAVDDALALIQKSLRRDTQTRSDERPFTPSRAACQPA